MASTAADDPSVGFFSAVLVFVYAFWRARRRNLSWRQPIQSLPVLAVPALATLIYVAFVRFTRRIDLKDHRRLKRLQEEKQASDGEPRKFNQNDLISAQESPVGGGEEVLDRLLDTVNTNFSASKENLIFPVKCHDSSFDRVLPASENFEKVSPEGEKEESLLEPHKSAALQTDTFAPEEIPISRAINDNGVIINPDEDTNALACICTNANINAAVANIDTGSPRLNFPAFQELHCEEFEDPVVSFSSSAELVMKGDEDAREKQPCGFNRQEGNYVLICSEEEALLGPPVVSTTEQYLKISDSDEVSKEELSYALHLKEQNGLHSNLEKDDFLDPLLVDIAEHSLATSAFLLCN
ncbi:hypothetical protein E2562_025638 [Oryza meyeriana var. granulata]|uniref:Uncharacterized protein n=1 Tax=Oryza meyeriana var. granulata TaxID=110450 RepID=A0A6G1FCI5_9ORYZ|nr:hypothetical protein E2562_025638 [Oryza meyeriana var. granulata]